MSIGVIIYFSFCYCVTITSAVVHRKRSIQKHWWRRVLCTVIHSVLRQRLTARISIDDIHRRYFGIKNESQYRNDLKMRYRSTTDIKC